MTVLLLRMAAPLQSWGTGSRFVRRNTDRAPSRSGIIGLLAAAQGRRRVDSIEDLLTLRIGVRVEQEGTVERDFQTARSPDGAATMPLSYRFYLSDAVFLAAVEGDSALLEGLRDALRRPAFPLYLGRKSCPPADRLDQGIVAGTVADALAMVAWSAAKVTMRRHREPTRRLSTVMDCAPGTPGETVVRDDPISFDQSNRQYSWRSVSHGSVTVPNPEYRGSPSTNDPHDPMGLIGSLT